MSQEKITSLALVLLACCCDHAAVGSGAQSAGQRHTRHKEPRATPSTVLVWYDNDSSNNGRPDRGWWPMNPNDPYTVPKTGQWRTMTSLLGTYSSQDPRVARQHGYQLVAMGASGVIVDWTNCEAQRAYPPPWQPGGMAEYCEGIKNSTRVLLREWHALRLAAPEDGGFDAPRVMVATRMPGANNATRQSWLADEVFSMHEAFPDGMVTIDDDTNNASKPALLTFFNPDTSWLQHGPQWSDTRFNNRYTNGFILDWKGAGVTQESTEWSYIDWPYWNFVEVSPITDKPGYYHNLYRRRVVSNESAQDRAYEQTNKQAAIAEQAAVWSAVELCDAPHALGQGCCGAGRPLPCRAVGGWSWDGWSNTTDGLTTLERYASSSIDKGLQYVTMNRWNYAVGWYDQPQEGLSRASSTFIEPSKEGGFTLYDSAAHVAHLLTQRAMLPPPLPRITVVNGTLQIKHPLWTPGVSGAPTRVCVSQDAGGCPDASTSWSMLNFNNVSSIRIPSHLGGRTVCVRTMNSFGTSPAACTEQQ